MGLVETANRLVICEELINQPTALSFFAFFGVNLTPFTEPLFECCKLRNQTKNFSSYDSLIQVSFCGKFVKSTRRTA